MASQQQPRRQQLLFFLGRGKCEISTLDVILVVVDASAATLARKNSDVDVILVGAVTQGGFSISRLYHIYSE